MDIGSVSATNAASSLLDRNSDPGQSDNAKALQLVRQRNLNIADRAFSVVRDPVSHKFVVRVVDRSTGAVLDQFPPESVLKLLSQLQDIKVTQGGSSTAGQGGSSSDSDGGGSTA